MDNAPPARAEIDALHKEYAAYISNIRADWLAKNRVRSKNVLEVMSSGERDEVHLLIIAWGVHVTPLAEAWWRERAYIVSWPSDAKDPMKVSKQTA